MRLLQTNASVQKSSMQTILRDIGEHYEVDGVHWRWAPTNEPGSEDAEFELEAGWQRASGGPGKVFTAQEVPWCLARIRAGEPICVDDLDELPAEAASDRRALRARGIEAVLVLGLMIDESILGVFSMSTTKSFHWAETMQDEVASLATILTNFYWSTNNRARLRQSEARYRAVVQDQTDLIVRWTPDGVTTWVNDRTCDYLQTSRKELIGSIESWLVSDKDWPQLQVDIANLIPESPAIHGEYETVLPSGEAVWQEWTDRGIFDEDRKLVEIQSVGRDITERKLAEAAREREAAFQRNKADLLSNLTTLKRNDADRSIDRSLEKIGQLYNAARISIWWRTEQEDAVECTHRWLEAGAPPSPLGKRVVTAELEWVITRLLSGDRVVVLDANELPDEASQFREFLKQTKCGAYLAFPFVVDGLIRGSITFAATHAHAWNDIAIDELEVLANILATALSGFRASEALARQAEFQARLAEISSDLLDASTADTREIIADIQARIGVDYGLDRVWFSWYEGAFPAFGKPITWSRQGTAVQLLKPASLPYAHRLNQQGKVLRIDKLDDLPAEARLDRAHYDERGIASLLVVPLNIGETIFGRAGFVRCQQRDWDDNTVNELQLLAHAITNAAVRQWSRVRIARREEDLARSQQVAKVGSYRMRATKNIDDESPDLLNVIDMSLTDQALEIFGISREIDPGVRADAVLSRIHPDDEPRVREAWRNTLRDHSQHIIEFRVVRPDGPIAHVQAREQFDSIDDKGVMTMFGTFKDITQWVESNQDLQSALSEIEKLKDQLQEENVFLREEVRTAHGFDKIIGESRSLSRVLESAGQVAPTDVTVLITGETGTGKELVARSIHDLSHRKDKAMICVNCAALSAELIESELFGHEKGAFTGAHDRRKGRFELADGGTLFLDEIGEISGELQAKLLRVIQEGKFERLGGSRTLQTDVRLIAATNRDLQRAVDSGEFRADIYYRINSFPIHMPPLRDRKEDIPLLAEHLVRKHAKVLGKDIESISARTLRYLQEQAWPGNIRELEGTILRALISTAGPVLDYIGATGETNAELHRSSPAAAMSLLEAQRQHIIDVLQQTNWVIEGKKGAALLLGLAPSSLRSKMKRLDVVRP